MRKAMVLVLATALAGCGTVPLEGGSPRVRGDAAHMTYTVNTAFAGLTWKLELDSASGAYKTTCTSLRGPACSSGLPVRQGTLTRAQVVQLFGDAARTDFRGLLEVYDMSGTFVDGPGYTLDVVVAGTSKSIQWSDAARPLPVALSRVVDAFRTATGTAE